MGRVNERTFYPALLELIREKGGTGVQEVTYNSVPDIQFSFLNQEWLLSVKLGETLAVVKSAFLQYMRHKEESRIGQGLLLILPDSFRRTKPTEEAVMAALRSTPVTVLVDAGSVKTEYRDLTFSKILDRLTVEVAALLQRGIESHYPTRLILDLLREQVVQMMEGLAVQERQLLRLVTDWKLLTELAQVEQKQAKDVAKFLAAYVFLSQVLFLRLFASVHPEILPDSTKITRKKLSDAFDRVLEINYKPIFKLEVLDAIPDNFLTDTFLLIWGMAVERVRFELPGRLFHALMPFHVRKLLAAFYTRPQAAELLARLTLQDADASVFDPACGSGTILTAAYRQKKQMYDEKGLPRNPHKSFCEDQLFGADIMPFAVHLTCANLAAMDVAETIEKTLIVQGDSLDMIPGKAYEGGVHQLGLFVKALSGRKTSGEEYEVILPQDGVDSILMNPPFTKVERRIADYVDMDKFKERVGGEVGLWGHFIALADLVLKAGGRCGAVIPISIMRGRESEKVRNFVFDDWTPRYLIKSTRSYAFSENAEYRDILFIADKKPAKNTDRVKVAYVKKNLAHLTREDVEHFAEQIGGRRHHRSAELDIDTHEVQDFKSRLPNMLWFLGTEDLAHRDVLVKFCRQFQDTFKPFPESYFGEGYRPVPKGVSKFLFVTRAFNAGRVEEAFLRFTADKGSKVHASTAMGTEFEISKSDLMPSLRTSVALNRMDISALHDYIATGPYKDLKRARHAAGHSGALPEHFWENIQRELFANQTKIAVARRLDFGSPNFHLACWTSEKMFSPSNQVNIIFEKDTEIAQALCVLLNSVFFWSQFFLLKEQSHARYFDIRFYDLYEMQLFPPESQRKELAAIYHKYKASEFPSFREQLDQYYDDRYREYWESQNPNHRQNSFWKGVLKQPVKPADVRINLDMEVCAASGLTVTRDQLIEMYEVMAKEIIITRRLVKD
jgi:predicted RNA methylase